MSVARDVALGALRALSLTGLPGRFTAVQRLGPWAMGSRRIGRRAGVSFHCDPDDEIQRLIYFGLYDQDETTVFLGRLRPGDTVLDVGANVGYYALLAARRVGPTGAVHAFEPIPANAATLRANAALNRFAHLRVNEAAVSDGSTDALTLYLRQGAGTSGWASIATSATRQNVPVTVPAIALDRYVADNGLERVAMVKMDIEGAEPFALAGGTGLFSRADAPDVLCEINPFILERAGSSGAVLVDRLCGFGYRVSEIVAGGRVADWTEPRDARVRNVLATKRD